MLAGSDHAFKVNFLQIHQRTRSRLRGEFQLGGQRYIAALNGITSGGAMSWRWLATRFIWSTMPFGRPACRRFHIWACGPAPAPNPSYRQAKYAAISQTFSPRWRRRPGRGAVEWAWSTASFRALVLAASIDERVARLELPKENDATNAAGDS